MVGKYYNQNALIRDMQKLVLDQAFNKLMKQLPKMSYQFKTPSSGSQTTSRRKSVFKQRTPKVGTTGKASGRVKSHRAKPVHTDYRKYGAILKYENGFETTDPDAVYVGGGLPKTRLADVICMAIVRRLFDLMGQPITSFEDLIYTSTGNLQLSFNWFQGSTDTSLSQANISISSNTSYRSLAETLRGNFVSTFVDTQHQLQDIWLNSITGSQQTHAIIRASDTYVDFGQITKVAIQNRTKAGTTVTDENDEQTNAVDNNPLRCRLYESYSNAVEPSYRQDGEANYEGFLAKHDTGFINAKASNTAIAILKKLPYPSFFRKTTSTKKFILQPGEIKYASVTYQKTMNLNKLMEEHFLIFTNSSNNVIGLGKTLFIGCSKMLDTRTSENPVLVGCEVNHLLRAKLKTRKPTAEPVITVV